MLSLFADSASVVSALFANDSWQLSEAMKSTGVWPVGLVVLLGGSALVLLIYRLVPLIDRHLERTVMVWTYLAIAAIIFVEVFRRFVLNQQAPWSTTLPPFLFLIMTWFGCAYNVRLRTHLAFNEFRTKLPRGGQMLCLTMDAVLWLTFCLIVVVTSTRVAANSAANFQILLGTDDILQWWFLATVPIAFILLGARVMENWLEDYGRYKSGKTIIEQAVIGGE